MANAALTRAQEVIRKMIKIHFYVQKNTDAEYDSRTHHVHVPYPPRNSFPSVRPTPQAAPPIPSTANDDV